MLEDPIVRLRWKWRDGDFVIWDESSTCHRALTDHYPQRRVMRRCTTRGEMATLGPAAGPSMPLTRASSTSAATPKRGGSGADGFPTAYSESADR